MVNHHKITVYLMLLTLIAPMSVSGLTFASGLAASTTIVHLLSAGDHIVSMDDLYGGTNRYLRKVADRMNIKTTFVDATNPENVEKAIQENTKVL